MWRRVVGILSIALGLMSIGGVLCFHFPEWLTTPELRSIYPVPFLRGLLAFFIFLTFAFGLLSFNLVGIALSVLATAMGGSRVEVPSAISSRYYLGLDWFILDLLIVGLVFIPFERLTHRLKSQKILRKEWKTDLAYFFTSHVLVQVTSLLILSPALFFSKRLAIPKLQALVLLQPTWLQFLEIVFVADLAQYWIHRAFHQIPFLWRFHEVHHSCTRMDWLAGSRIHLIDLVVTRGLVLVPLMTLGFGDGPLRAYLVFVAFLATYIHANTRYTLAALREVVVTPVYHHWHHAAEARAVDKNFAVHLPLFDRLFGTYYLPRGRWPSSYGSILDSK